MKFTYDEKIISEPEAMVN